MKLRALVVDDEPLSRERIVRLLEGDDVVEVVGECGDGAAAVREIRAQSPDLVLMDVQMPEMDGFAVLRALGPGQVPRVVFVTAFDRYAIRAFEVHALDYVLKPFTPERLREAVRRAAARAQGRREADTRLLALLEDMERAQRTLRHALPAAPRAEAPDEPARRIPVKTGDRTIFVPVERVDWLEAEGNYVRLHAGKERHLIRATMAAMEAQLDRRRFVRIHRSTIVNLERVREVRPWFAGDCIVVLDDGRELRLSRRYRDRLDALLASAS